jgi:hypothetical protein
VAYDLELADRIRTALARRRGIAERKMFGCVAFFLKGHVLVGVWKRSLIVRLGPAADAALAEPHVRPFDITGTAMKGWAAVDPEGLAAEGALEDWIARSLAFVRTLPARNE